MALTLVFTLCLQCVALRVSRRLPMAGNADADPGVGGSLLLFLPLGSA